MYTIHIIYANEINFLFASDHRQMQQIGLAARTTIVNLIESNILTNMIYDDGDGSVRSTTVNKKMYVLKLISIILVIIFGFISCACQYNIRLVQIIAQFWGKVYPMIGMFILHSLYHFGSSSKPHNIMSKL